MFICIYFVLAILAVVCLLGCLSTHNCQGLHQQEEECVFVSQCPHIYEILLKSSLSPDEVAYVQSTQCGYIDQQPLVMCCKNNEHLLPEPGVCGPDTSNRIYGGNITNIDEYPWLALILYKKPGDRNRLHSFCGGFLINNRYIVTAAHCSYKRIDLIKPNYILTSVRLGEWDIASERDCENGNNCSDPPRDIDVEEQIVHENYDPNSKHQDNDIALLRLKELVQFTTWIKPICLPRSEYLRNTVYDGLSLIASGWGKTENGSYSNFKLKVNLDGVSQQRCKTVYSRDNINISSKQLCAGGILGFDTCLGDSGGPLIALDMSNRKRPYYYSVGIVSFGSIPCGKQGWPAVYTRVSKYVNWIIIKIRE